MKFQNKGFTLVELVITMILLSIIFMAAAGFIVTSMRSYTAITRRAQLVQQADMALIRMARDIRAALPNSLRVTTLGSTVSVEYIDVVESIRYQAQGANAINFNAATSSFNVMGAFQNVASGVQPYRLVIYNVGAISGGNFSNPLAGYNAYGNNASGPFPPSGSNVINSSSQTVTFGSSGGNGTVTIGSGGWQFSLTSPQQRLYIVDTPVSYVCTPSASNGNITRYSSYSIQSSQPINTASPPLSVAGSIAQLTGNVTACSFTYTTGTPQRNGVLNMSITLSNSGETVTLMRQVSVDNVP